MTSEDRLRQALRLFDAALDQPESERDPWLQLQCKDDFDLLVEVRSLLAADAQDALSDARLDVIRSHTSPHQDDAAADTLIGSRIGAWQVTGVLGHGGMGAVFAVERADGGFAQCAALKRIRIGLDTPLARDRFLRERQILAQLHHPGIAQLLDGGTDAHNAPYFVMERVDGERIDHWCDTRKLDLRARVTLFLQVLDAVAYAHRNLIVHRDIKPANIQVDATGHVKLLDFGIARLSEDSGDAHTRTLERVLTPEFAAPEQLLGEAVGTATDIYQLGVLLFCLLCGQHPHGITGDTPLRQQLKLLERDAGRASSLALKLPRDIALAHAAEPAQLARSLRGDLDVILGKALQREPNARYPDANSFRSDLAAWLDGRPVSAREPSLGYRLRRFLARYRWPVAGATFATLALLAGAAISLWQAHEAKLQTQRADAVSAYLTGIFTSIDPDDGWGKNVSVRDLLDEGLQRLDSGALRQQPDAEAQLRGTLAGTLTALGDFDAGKQQVEHALQIARAPDLQHSLRLQLAELHIQQGAFTQAQRMLEQLDVRIPADSALRETLLHLHAKLAAIEEKPERALRYIAAATRLAQTRLGTKAPHTLDLQEHYALLRNDAGQSDAAIAQQEQVLAQLRNIHAPPARIATALHNLAVLRNDAGHPDQAIAPEQQALQLREQSLPATHPLLAQSAAYLGFLYGKTPNQSAAMTQFAHAVTLLEKQASPDFDMLGTTHNNWAVSCYGYGDRACAETHLQQAITAWSRIYPDDHYTLLSARNNLASVLSEKGQLKEAEATMRSIITIRLRKRDSTLSNTVGLASSYNMLAYNLVNQERADEAVATAQHALTTLQDAKVTDQAAYASAWNAIAYAEWAAGRCDASVPHARTAVQLAEESHSDDRLRPAQQTLARCLVKSKNTAQEGIALMQPVIASTSEDNSWNQQARSIQAEGLMVLGQRQEATRMVDALLQELQGKPNTGRTIRRLLAIRARGSVS